MKKILATAYAVNPYKGSEDGMGWNFVLQIARFNEVIAITRENNRDAIESYMAEHPSPLYANIRFEYFDLSYALRFWKRKGRGAMLYFYLWQASVPLFVKKKQIAFDVAHNLNFHNDWTPTFLWTLGKPMVWGAVGHHAAVPDACLAQYAKSTQFSYRLKTAVKSIWERIDPFLQVAKKKSNHIFLMNTSAMQYGKNIELKSSIMPSVASEAAQFLSIQPAKKSKFIALSVGRFVALKGFDLTIKSFATFYHGLSAEEKEHAELVLIGKGPQEAKMRDWIAEENIEECTTIIPWVERAELIGYYEKASVLLFPSHEGAGMVVSEALAHGLPVVCLDNDGPGEFVTPQCGMATPIGNYDDMLMGLGASLYKLFRDKTLYGLLSKGAVRRHEKAFHWNRRGEHIAEVYDKVMSSAEAQSERDFAPILSPCI